jgi:hypothetical protein
VSGTTAACSAGRIGRSSSGGGASSGCRSCARRALPAVTICDILSSYRQARLENAAAPDAAASHKQAVTPAGSGTPAKIQLSDHNLPLRAGDELQTIEWLTRAKSLKAGMIPFVFVRLPPAHRPPLTAPRSSPPAHRPPLTAPRSPPPAHRPPLTALRSPPPLPRRKRAHGGQRRAARLRVVDGQAVDCGCGDRRS